MFGLNVGPNFVDYLDYVNNFLLYVSRFRMQLLVIIVNDLDGIKSTFYSVIIRLVIQHIPAFMSLAPSSTKTFGLVFQIIINFKKNTNLVISTMKYLSELYHTKAF